MKRPILIITIGYIIGIILGLYFKIGIAFLLLLFIVKKYIKLNNKMIIVLAIIIIISYSNILYKEYKYDNLFKDVESISGVGLVISNPKENEYSVSYNLKLIQADKYKNLKDKKVVIKLNKKKDVLKFGDVIHFNGTFKYAEVQRNYGGFDYREYLKSQNIFGLIEVETVKKITSGKAGIISTVCNTIQNSIINQIHKLDNKETAEILIGILLGNTNNISEETIEDFKNSGLSHLMAVSGLNVTYVVLAVLFLLKKAKLEKRISNITVIFFIIIFMYITDFTDSVTRAGIMAIIIITAQISYRKPDITGSICFSLLLILIYNPYKIFSVGLQLSYAGTIGIVVFYNKFKDKINSKNNTLMKLLDIILVCIAAQIVVMPIMLIQFNSFSIYFLIANVLASPLIGVIMLLGFLFLFISYISIKIAAIIYFPLKITVQILMYINSFVANMPFSVLLFKTPYFFSFVFFYIIIFKKIKKKILVFILIILLTITLVLDYPKGFKLYFIDVGQGDSTLVVTNTNKKILIDGGGSEFGTFDVGKNTLIPYLLDRRITTIDYVIISHFDSDHCLGLFEVIKKLRVKNIIIPKQFKESNNYQTFLEISKNKRVFVAKSNDKIFIDKHTIIEVLWPINKYITDNILNNNSLVFKMIYKNISILFTGDIEEKAENVLVSKYKDTNRLKSDILKVAHHGSRTSSTIEFLKLANPKVALIGCKKDNNFGHPHEEIINRLNERNIRIYRTDNMGEIEVLISNGNIKSKPKIE